MHELSWLSSRIWIAVALPLAGGCDRASERRGPTPPVTPDGRGQQPATDASAQSPAPDAAVRAVSRDAASALPAGAWVVERPAVKRCATPQACATRQPRRSPALIFLYAPDPGRSMTVIVADSSRDGAHAISAGRDREARRRDVRTGRPAGVLRGHRSRVHAARLLPDGRARPGGPAVPRRGVGSRA